jgi:hypothetical protein
MDTSTDPIPGRNLKLGLIIGGIVIAQMVVFIILFTRNGLPKDPDILKEQEARAAYSASKEAHE